jgi:hypothetical protein
MTFLRVVAQNKDGRLEIFYVGTNGSLSELRSGSVF